MVSVGPPGLRSARLTLSTSTCQSTESPVVAVPVPDPVLV
jgi:hypothetical protein